jgi:hypothetical protein
MVRLLAAVAVGILLAIGTTWAVTGYMTDAANGTPSSSSLYNYGNR